MCILNNIAGNKMTSFAYVADVLEKFRTNPLQTDYQLVNIKGIPQNPTFNTEKCEKIMDSFQTRAEDVFISTYVKAGTTWTQQIVHLLLRKGSPGGFYSETIPWLEAVCSDMLKSREAPTWTLDKINSTLGRRYFKTHATVDHLPGRANTNNSEPPKVIYVARNPKDTAVSLYYHAKSKPEFGFTGDFNTFCTLFLAGQVENGSWFHHVLEWYRQAQENPDRHLFLRYEDMCDNPSEAVRKIAAFLGLEETTEEIVEEVVKNSSIGEMRQKASIGLNHLRQGGYGGWRTMFSVAMSELFDDVYRLKIQVPQEEWDGPKLTFNFGSNSVGEIIVL